MSDVHTFKGLFTFDPAKVLMVGVERELLLTDADGAIVPRAPEALEALQAFNHGGRFGYELSACQVESHTPPSRIEDLLRELQEIDDTIETALRPTGLKALYQEVAPADMPLDVFPDPTGRYQAITALMPRPVLLAACQITGTHVHVGMPDHDTALRVYNRVTRNAPRLCRIGDNSQGERLLIYQQVKADCMPRPYDSWVHLHRAAVQQGFANNPRDCWTLIRISKYGTIEFRMFGSTSSTLTVFRWARACHRLCARAMN